MNHKRCYALSPPFLKKQHLIGTTQLLLFQLIHFKSQLLLHFNFLLANNPGYFIGLKTKDSPLHV